VKTTRKCCSLESQMWSATVRSETDFAWSSELDFSSRGWLRESRRDVAEFGGTALSSVSLWPDAKLKYLCKKGSRKEIVQVFITHSLFDYLTKNIYKFKLLHTVTFNWLY
jgi:hypothetical protein